MNRALKNKKGGKPLSQMLNRMIKNKDDIDAEMDNIVDEYDAQEK